MEENKPPEEVPSATQEEAGAAAVEATPHEETTEQPAIVQAAATATTTTTAPAAAEEPKEDSDSDDDDDEGVIEESPCGRYIKRKEVIKYRDVPGIDTAYLAMDTEEGVEVVWNEAIFSGTKKFKSKEETKLKKVFEALTLIDHPNIVKFHRFWTDNGETNEKSGQTNPPRLVFITEFMSAGSLKQFLRKTKRNNRKIQVQSWKRWCTQILSALNYLHATCDPSILHGNLTCDTIFIQHNGLVKIGSVAPDIIHQNVKTCRDNIARNKHFLAPEWGTTTTESALNTAIDIYAFGMCALETAALELLPAQASNGNGSGAHSTSSTEASANGGATANGNQDSEAGVVVTEESIQRTIDSLEDEMQKDFIRKCLRKKPAERPTARELLFHPVLFEVHSLKLLAAHILVNTPANINETMTDEAIQTHYGRDTVMATVKRMSDGKIIEYKLSDFPVAEKLEKFMEDVKYGIYPLTAFALSQPPPPKTRAVTPSEGPIESAQSVTPEPFEPEDRWGVEFKCYIGPTVPAAPSHLTLLTKLCDSMNRQMQADLSMTDTPESIATEMLEMAIINWRDVPSIAKLMTMAFIQRANETAEYVAKMENNVGGNAETGSNADGGQEAAEKPATVSVQGHPVPPQQDGESGSAQAEQANAAHEEAAPANDEEIFEDPTPPQALEGRLAGVEPLVGTPQMTLADAVAAGNNNGGLHFPKEKFQFTGSVCEIDKKLQVEIEEWQTRLQEHLREQQKEQANAQNGAANEEVPTANNNAASSATAATAATTAADETEERSSSQQRE